MRTRNVGSQFGAGLKSLVVGELKGMTKMLAAGRDEARDRLCEEVAAEICAYGTAVRVRKRM